jgi:hypothetical protein
MTTLATLMGLGGGDWPMWTPALTVEQWATVRSPADGELYMRRAATGTSATDPADDIYNYSAVSYQRTAARTSAGLAWRGGTSASLVYANNASRAAFPAVAKGVRTLVFSVNGRGAIDFLGVGVDSSSLYSRFEVIVDGRWMADYFGVFSSGTGITLIGSVAPSNADNYGGLAVDDNLGIEFRRGLQVYATPDSALLLSAGANVFHRIRSHG